MFSSCAFFPGVATRVSVAAAVATSGVVHQVVTLSDDTHLTLHVADEATATRIARAFADAAARLRADAERQLDAGFDEGSRT